MSNPNWDGHILHGPNVPLYVHGAFNPQYGPELFFFSFLFHSMTLFLDILLMKTSEWPLAARGAASDKSGRERANALSPCTRLNRSSWSAQAALAPLSEMCLTLQHLSGLDRNNPQPNSGGCHLEICAGKESVSAYSNKPHLQPHLSHQNSLSPFLLPTALNTSSIAEMLEKSKEGKK